jgi:uncharacterized phage-like protein YoqJ
VKHFTFIGNRIQDLGGFTANALQTSIKEVIHETVRKHKDEVLLTSLALGVETFAAESCRDLKVSYKVVVPFKGYPDKWIKSARVSYATLLRGATASETLSQKGYSPDQLKTKDIHLIDSSDTVYTFYNPVPGYVMRFFQNGKNLIDLMPDGPNDDFFIKI